MRTLHADLLSKLTASSIQPAIQMVFTSQDGLTTYDYSFDPTVTTNRAERLEFRFVPFDEYAQITLRNNDLAVPDLVGYYVDLGIGANTDSGLRYGDYPRLWVKEQHTLSGGVKEGRKDLKVILKLQGAWNILMEQFVLIGDAPFYQDEHGILTGKTIYGILEELIEVRLYSITGSIFQFTLDALGDQDDGVIDTIIYEPVKDPDWPIINEGAPARYETFLEVFERLLAVTGCYLLVRDNLTFKIVYPQASDAVNETYYSSLSDGHVFYESIQDQYVNIPNRVKKFSDQSAAHDWSSYLEGDAYNADDWDLSTGTFTGEYMHVIDIADPDTMGIITSQGMMDSIVGFILNKHNAERFGGRVVIPFDPRVELYDKVQVIDERGL